ncbi:Catalase [Luteitalea pratensis]|uniref:Catalase n=1 Tax=Luteitalea pratensis TaxID=1855912 RepID=A0A143PM12_LUTPR|nr:catalase family protein [Luteitalea pratensis]AMY09243.1 Catalase [Luteitalea pratensis]
MKRELGREYPELDDPKVFERMVALTIEQMEPVRGHLRRGQHAKATGCVTAEFRIVDDVPQELRHGIFSRPGRTFRALVRFSNSQATFEKDGVGTARGLAIKLLDVAGTRAVPGDGDTTQDFLMIDHPVFPFPDPKTYTETIGRKNIPLVGNLVAAAHLILLEREQLQIVNEIKGKHVASPLEIKYWSGTPFRLGPATGDPAHAVKYSVVSHQADRTIPSDHPENLPDDYFTRALTASLATADAVFDFKVQVQNDADAMPVEDVSVEWSEEDSKPVTLATLRIPTQKVEADGELATQCEALSFNPWHAIVEHRPIGGMNRLRKAVYQASVDKRSSH